MRLFARRDVSAGYVAFQGLAFSQAVSDDPAYGITCFRSAAARRCGSLDPDFSEACFLQQREELVDTVGATDAPSVGGQAAAKLIRQLLAQYDVRDGDPAPRL